MPSELETSRPISVLDPPSLPFRAVRWAGCTRRLAGSLIDSACGWVRCAVPVQFELVGVNVMTICGHSVNRTSHRRFWNVGYSTFRRRAWQFGICLAALVDLPTTLYALFTQRDSAHHRRSHAAHATTLGRPADRLRRTNHPQCDGKPLILRPFNGVEPRPCSGRSSDSKA